MDPIKIIQKFYQEDSKAYGILVAHSRAVTNKALVVAGRVPQLNPDLAFICEAGMLHDIGIFLTDAHEIGCFGEKQYICHGYLGRELLDKEGLSRHALVCERHVGVGLTVEDIRKQQLPVPERDMRPISIEEQIISFADKFFSKTGDEEVKEKSVEQVRNELRKHGELKVVQFDLWFKKFGY